MDYNVNSIIWELKEECGTGCIASYIREKRVVMCRCNRAKFLNLNWIASRFSVAINVILCVYC